MHYVTKRFTRFTLISLFIDFLAIGPLNNSMGAPLNLLLVFPPFPFLKSGFLRLLVNLPVGPPHKIQNAM